jgi:hypothetical protein
MVIFYFFFESHIMKALTWGTGDGMINWFAVGRLEENEQRDAIASLTRSPFAKTRLFAIQAADRMDIPEGLKRLPELIKDPNWEVRMKAISIARRRRYRAAGRVILERIVGRGKTGESQRRDQLEGGSLLESIDEVAAPENSEMLAKLALMVKNPPVFLAARAALWKLGPLPQAELAYVEILKEPGKMKASWADRSACLEAAAVLDLPGTLERLIQAAREAPANSRLRAIHSLGSLSGEGAKKFLQAIVDAPEWQKKTKFDKQRVQEAEKALERIRRKEQGLPDLEAQPVEEAQPNTPADAGGEISVDDLLDSYGSDASEPTSGSADGDGPKESLEDLLNGP